MKLQGTETKSNHGSDIFREFPKKFLPALPPTFSSLLGTPIGIQTDQPREVIKLERDEPIENPLRQQNPQVHEIFSFRRLLGNLLGVTDYATNMPAFWFLDTLALHVLRYKQDLDEYYIGVLISWLAGEIRLLRGNKLIERLVIPSYFPAWCFVCTGG